jgi:hypothetical protein
MFGVKLASHPATVLRGDGNQGFKLLSLRDGGLMVVSGAGKGSRGGGGEGEGWGCNGGSLWRGFPSTGSINHYYLSVGRLADGG